MKSTERRQNAFGCLTFCTSDVKNVEIFWKCPRTLLATKSKKFNYVGILHLSLAFYTHRGSWNDSALKFAPDVLSSFRINFCASRIDRRRSFFLFFCDFYHHKISPSHIGTLWNFNFLLCTWIEETKKSLEIEKNVTALTCLSKQAKCI